MNRHWLTVRQVAEELEYTEDTVRQYCAEGVFPNATKATDNPRAHWRIPEQDVREFGTNRAIQRTPELDHRRRKQLMAARRAA